MAIDEFYPASFGGIRLWFASVDTENSRTLVVHALQRGNIHPVQDRGQELKTAQCVLLFDDMQGERESGLTRFTSFRDLVNAGEPQIFTHPTEGSYLARVGAFSHAVNGEGVITAQVTFVPVEEARAVSPAGSGTSLAAGEGAITSAVDTAREALEEYDLESDALDDAESVATSWQEDEPNTRAIVNDVSRIATTIGQDIEALNLEGNITLWPAFRSMIMLADAVLSAGRAAAQVSRIITIRIARPIALRRLVAKLYGANDADERYVDVMSLNDIATPAWIPAGTELRIPQPPPQQRRA